MNEITDTVETVDAFERLMPSTLRSQREELGVSRAVLQKATGLSSSVVWRAEQEDAKPITDDEYLNIMRTLDEWSQHGVPTEYAKSTKTHAPAGADAAEAARQLAARYQEFLTELADEIGEAITERKAKKASTKDLVTLEARVMQFLQDVAASSH